MLKQQLYSSDTSPNNRYMEKEDDIRAIRKAGKLEILQAADIEVIRNG